MDNREQTDWDRYYRAPAPTAHLLRRITSGRLIAALIRTQAAPFADEIQTDALGNVLVRKGSGGKTICPSWGALS